MEHATSIFIQHATCVYRKTFFDHEHEQVAKIDDSIVILLFWCESNNQIMNGTILTNSKFCVFVRVFVAFIVSANGFEYTQSTWDERNRMCDGVVRFDLSKEEDKYVCAWSFSNIRVINWCQSIAFQPSHGLSEPLKVFFESCIMRQQSVSSCSSSFRQRIDVNIYATLNQKWLIISQCFCV